MTASLRDLGRRVDALPPAHFDARDLMRQGDARRRRRRQAVAAGAVITAAVVGMALRIVPDLRDAAPPPASSDHGGVWVTTDADGSTSTMVVRSSGGGAYDVVVRDESAGVCSGSSSTMTGAGRLDGATDLVIPTPAYRCDDGSKPQVESGPPLEEQLRDLTFVHHPRTDTLTDNFGLVWDRGGTTESSGAMWPQTSTAEVQAAQAGADAGDARFTWQLFPDIFPKQAGERDRDASAFFTRFLQEELGWEEFRWSVAPGLYAGVADDWPWEFVVVRCAPGRTNPMYSGDSEGRGCAPTLEDNRYETVRLGADQPSRSGPSGIWTVSRWSMLAPATSTNGLMRVAPPGNQRQVQQVAPPSVADASALVRAFLEARVEGDGAEEYLHDTGEQTPLLYATSAGAPYERSELELVAGPVWPGGWMEYTVRLFAAGGTVVEQHVVVDRRDDGRLVLVYGTLDDPDFPTTENGKNLAEPYSILDGDVTLGVAPPWYGFLDYGPDTIVLVNGDRYEEKFAVLADPLPVRTGCRLGSAPSRAEALVRSIRANPGLEATKPVVEVVGGIDALRMDVVLATGPTSCPGPGTNMVVSGPRSQGPVLGEGDRMRLYLLDLPAGSSARTLAIAFSAPEASFDAGLEQDAERILDSFGFHTS